MAGTGEAAKQRHFTQGLRTLSQQLAGTVQASGQQVLMRRQTEACPEHPREVVFGQVAAQRQLTQRQRLFEVGLDIVRQLPALVPVTVSPKSEPMKCWKLAMVSVRP